MKIALSQIKPSPNPIRKTWDEQKMEELKWSLMEESQVEPVGLYLEAPDKFRIIWGHRRVEAARRAGWDEIDAVILPLDEVDNLIQAGIENLSGEDMTTDDKARWAQKLLDLGMEIPEISRRSTVPRSTIEKWLIYINEPEIKSAMAHPKRSGDTDYRKVVEISRTLGNDLEAKKAIAKKVSDDELSTTQTRAVAEAYRDAPTPEVKQAILKAPIISKDTVADILRRSINRVELDSGTKVIQETNDWQKEREERRTFQNYDLAVKEHIDSIRLFLESVKKGSGLIKFGKYSPEAALFVIRKHNSLIEELKSYNDLLETVK